MPSRLYIHAFVFLASLLAGSSVLRAEDNHRLSTNLYGSLGLNTVPSARMDEKGTMRAGVSTLDPYTHAFIGFQIADPLYVSLRQTAEVSNINDNADRLYPGVDFKLRLREESRYGPEISLGMNSALGHKRMASEYVVLSKRYKNFDFTGGLAWGRLGSAGHLSNPLRIVASHFDRERDYNSESPVTIDDWFTGPDVGLFAGLEYFTPIDGLSVKADWGADRYTGERQALDFQSPGPWSLSLNYQPWDFVDINAGIVGTDKVMARLSLQDQVFNWPGKPAPTMKPFQPNIFDRISLDDLGKEIPHTAVALDPYEPTSAQIGRAARMVAEHTDPGVQDLTVTTTHMSLKGPQIRLIRRDVESALSQHGSPEEIWQDTAIYTNYDDVDMPAPNIFSQGDFKFILDLGVSLSEEDSGAVYRTSAIVEQTKQWPFGFISGSTFRLNIKDNLHRLQEYRPQPIKPIRSDVDNFTQNLVGMDRSYMGWLHSINPSVHVGVQGGWLEEMYAGAGGEILIRPFGRALVIGAEGWHVYKRDPQAFLNLDTFDESVTTGHFNMWYEVPDSNVTLEGKVGQYLGDDFGGTFAVNTRFDNGATLRGFVTVSDEADADIFGGATHLYSGLQLSLPFGNVHRWLKGSEARITAAPFGRDTGQVLDKPLPLYDLTEPMSYRQIARSWPEVLN